MQIAQENAATAATMGVALPESGSAARSPYADYKIIRRNGAVVGFEPAKISVAMTKAFLAVNGGQGAASARVREHGRRADRGRGQRADAPPAAGRHLPYRRHPGPGRARADALRRARRRARLRAVPRGARARRRAPGEGARKRKARRFNVVENGSRKPLDRARLHARWSRSACEGLADASAAGDPRSHAARPLRRRADGGSAQVRDPRGARADREGPGLQLRHRAAAARHPPPRSAGRGSDARPTWRRATPRISRSSSSAASRPSCSTRALAQLRPEEAGRGARRRTATCSSATSACRRSTTAISCTCSGQRIELPQAFFMRVAMGLALNEEEPRSARDRVLQRALELRLHELDADAVQLRHAALAALELLPHHGVGRPRRHLRRDQGKRAARQVRRRPRQRLDAGARAGLAHQGHQRQVAGRGAVPEGGERHRGGGQPGRQAQGRGVLLPRDLAPRHRGVPRAAQEHRRRPPPHARHEHRELDSGPVHEAGDGGRASGRCSRPPTCRDLHDKFGKSFEEAYLRYEDKAARGELKLLQEDSRAAAVAQDAVDAVRDRASLDHLQGSRATSAARSSTSAWCTARTCAPRSRSTPRPTRSRCATWARSTWSRT